jgi:16S rRNA (uracil1498-N3)-methyltransferase
MSRRRWIADQVSGDRAFLLGRNAEHLARVLRVRVGQEFDVSTGDAVRLGRIVQVADERVEFELGELVPQKTPARVTLLLAIFKFDRMEWAIKKAAELGASEIVPVIARRTDVRLASAAVKRVERWRRIAHEAAQQSRRVSPPEIAAPQPLQSTLSVAADLRIVLAETEHATTLKQSLSQIAPSTIDPRPPAVCLAVGPEGGWSAEELAAFTTAGWISASLGNTILRAETAALAALAIAMSELTEQS